MPSSCCCLRLSLSSFLSIKLHPISSLLVVVFQLSQEIVVLLLQIALISANRPFQSYSELARVNSSIEEHLQQSRELHSPNSKYQRPMVFYNFPSPPYIIPLHILLHFNELCNSIFQEACIKGWPLKIAKYFWTKMKSHNRSVLVSLFWNQLFNQI